MMSNLNNIYTSLENPNLVERDLDTMPERFFVRNEGHMKQSDSHESDNEIRKYIESSGPIRPANNNNLMF